MRDKLIKRLEEELLEMEVKVKSRLGIVEEHLETIERLRRFNRECMNDMEDLRGIILELKQGLRHG